MLKKCCELALDKNSAKICVSKNGFSEKMAQFLRDIYMEICLEHVHNKIFNNFYNNQGGIKTMAKLTSPMSGKIQEVNIKVGQMVTEDDELFIIEAMKMENAVYGDAGVVKEIYVKEGDRVEEDDPLAEIE